MGGISSIKWTLASHFGIWMGNGWGDPHYTESESDAWNSGHVNDVLMLSTGVLLAATDTSGVWSVPLDGGPALCLSESWPDCRFRSLAQGIAPLQVFAAGTGLYVSDVSKPAPLFDWVRVANLPKKTGMIHRVLVLPEAHMVVLACDLGILWSPIPPLPGVTFTWNRAEVDGVTTGGFYDVAPGLLHQVPPRPGASQSGFLQDVIAGGTGGAPIGKTIGGGSPGPTKNPASSAGLFLGRWGTDGVLRFHRAAFILSGGRADDFLSGCAAISVASSKGNRSRAYACCAVPVAGDSPHLYGILRSDDGGQSWKSCGKTVEMITDHTLAELAGHQGNYNNCIAVATWDPDIVAFGFNHTFLSFNGGITWEPLGIDADGHYQRPRHLHADIHGLLFTDTFPDSPQDLYIASDGGIATATWGKGGCIIESDHRSDAVHGDLEVVVLESNSLVHYTRPSGDPLMPFSRQNAVTTKATGAGCLIVSERWTGTRRNYDLVVLEGTELVHYWTDNADSPPKWNRAQVITSQATGPGCIIESNYLTGSIFNFEVVVPEGSNLIHYWHGGADRNTPWHRVPTPITTHAASAGCLIQSTFPTGADNGNFEVVVLEDGGGALGRGLVHYWRTSTSGWNGPIMITRNATSQGWFIQNYGVPDPQDDFQLVVQEAGVLAHWYRDNSGPPYAWHYRGSILGPFEKASGPGCIFQSSTRGPDSAHRHLHLVACIGGKLEYRYLDTSAPALPWPGKWVITNQARTYFSGMNRQLPILQFYGPDAHPLSTFGASKLIPGLIAGGTQDNGVLYSTASHNGPVPEITPWFEPEGGDGGPVAFLPAHSETGNLSAAGRVLVECNNQEESNVPVGAKSRRWNNATGRLVGYPDPNRPVIPLLSISPIASPPPDPAFGLVDPFLKPVARPRYRRGGAFLCAVGATGPDVYGLFLLDAADEGQFEPPRWWDYIGSIKDASGQPQLVTALASSDGMTILVAATPASDDGPAAATAIAKGFSYRLDTDTGNTSILSANPTLGDPVITDLVITGPNEAYGNTLGGDVIHWNGIRWEPTSALPDIALVAITADLSLPVPPVFVVGQDQVFVSTDRGATWRAASSGLPTSVLCSDIDWVKDANGSRLYLSTYGRSAWMALQTEL
jgi:hypothetical protein